MTDATNVTIQYPRNGKARITRGEIHPRGTGARLSAVLELLAALQWVGENFFMADPYHCPVCHEHALNGHAPDCRLAALLEGEQCGCLLARAEKAEARLAQAIDLLGRLKLVNGVCPSCGYGSGSHASHCELSALLRGEA